VYSVISPEGCASILWRDAAQASIAAESLRLTAQDLRSLRLVDGVVPEPLGGAHRMPAAAVETVGRAVEAALTPLLALAPAALLEARRDKYLAMGRDAIAL
jgi:acetyl-CoA carboxylase carboxyl transferase subunit alpha